MENKTIKTRNGAIYPILFGFFIMGFVDVVGIATNYVKVDFNLSDTLANTIPMMVFLWFALFSIPTGLMMGKIGRKKTVLVALFVNFFAMLLPLFVYDFAAVLLAFTLLGIGNTILQVSLNPMVSQVVNEGKLTSVLTLGQFIKAISSFLGPIIAGTSAAYFGDWKFIFIIYSAVSVLSILWMYFSVPDIKDEKIVSSSFATTISLFKDKYVLLLFLGILFIVGIDVGLNTSIPKLLMEKTGMSLNEAGLGISLYFAARTIGAFAGAILLARYSPIKFLKYTMISAIICFVLLLMFSQLWLLFAMIVIIGLACANVFSIIFSSALQHKPERSNEISALMIMGVSGGALVMPIMGYLSDSFGQVAGISILLICLVYILGLSFKLKG